MLMKRWKFTNASAAWTGTKLDVMGSQLTSDALRKSCDIVHRQRRVAEVGGRGGSEDTSCKHQTHPPSAPCAQTGPIAGTSVSKDLSSQNIFGRSGCVWNWQRTIVIWPSSILQSTATTRLRSGEEESGQCHGVRPNQGARVGSVEQDPQTCRFRDFRRHPRIAGEMDAGAAHDRI